MLFETDFPHPTCQHPGPATTGRQPRATTPRRRSPGCPTTSLAKVLHDNAAKVFNVR